MRLRRLVIQRSDRITMLPGRDDHVPINAPQGEWQEEDNQQHDSSDHGECHLVSPPTGSLLNWPCHAASLTGEASAVQSFAEASRLLHRAGAARDCGAAT